MIRILILLLPFLFSCNQTDLPKVFSKNVMTIDYRILIGDNINTTQSEGIQRIIDETFNEANQVYNKFNKNSELSKLNSLKAAQKQKLSPLLENLLNETHQIVELTQGSFDPTILPLYDLWKTSLENEHEPSNNDIQKIMPAIGWYNIHIENGEFWKDYDATQIDLGGIAKGYCVDLLIERIKEMDVHSAYVEWGGEIRAIGSHPENRPWRIFISRLGDPNPEHAIDIVNLSDEAMATSGDYNQYWEIDGKTYFHIIDPKTGRPLERTQSSIASASILAETCTLADGLATAAMIFPTVRESQEWLSKIPRIRFWLATREND